MTFILSTDHKLIKKRLGDKVFFKKFRALFFTEKTLVFANFLSWEKTSFLCKPKGYYVKNKKTLI